MLKTHQVARSAVGMRFTPKATNKSHTPVLLPYGAGAAGAAGAAAADDGGAAGDVTVWWCGGVVGGEGGIEKSTCRFRLKGACSQAHGRR